MAWVSTLTRDVKTILQFKGQIRPDISERNVTEGVSVLLKTAKDEDRKVRVESFRSLSEIASPDKLDDIINLLMEATGSSERIEAQKTVAAVACRIEQKNGRAERILAVLSTVQDNQNRCSLINVLGRIGDSNSLPVLVNALKDENADVQIAAVRTLADWPRPEPLLDLLDVAANSDVQTHKILALRGFIRQLGLDDKHSDKEKVKLYEKAMSLAANIAEKQKVLSGLSEVSSPDALETAVTYLGDETLGTEAAIAVIKISESIYPEYPRQSGQALERIISITNNDSLRKRAQELMEKIKQL